MPMPVVTDLSHHYWGDDRVPDFATARQAGLLGVIYKASQGSGFRDKTYAKTRDMAKAAGLLWGAYHFATKADAKSQVANFLNSAAPETSDLIAIDFERNERDPANSAEPEIALAILKGCEDRLGRRPVLYTGSYMYDLYGNSPAPPFAPYKLWWARYAPMPQVHPTWETYWLWQFTDGMHGPEPRKVAGIGYVDYDHFDGPAERLTAEWAIG